MSVDPPGPLPPPPPPRSRELPPPPAGAPPGTATAGLRTRPGFVTAAATILIVLGGLGAVAGAVLLAFRSAPAMQDLGFGARPSVVGVLGMVLGALEIVAGVLVLHLSNAGRILGLVLAGLGVLGGISGLASAEASGVGALVLNGLVVYALVAYAPAFRRAGGG